MRGATSIRLSYPAELSEWGRESLERDSVRSYLRTAHETASPGDRWEEFLGVGCCGDSLDVPLVVEAVEGGTRVTGETAIEFVERADGTVRGGWQVQSADGPTE